MRTYRLYIIDPFNGTIAETRRFVVPDDETAIWISEGFRHSRPMELWNGPSKIHSWDLIATDLQGDAPAAELQLPEPTIPAH